MNGLRRAIAVTALLAACQPAGELEISVSGPSSVTFSLAGDSAEACFENLRISENGATADSPAIWEVEKTYVAPTSSATDGVLVTEHDPECVTEIHFPEVPKGFKLISSEPVKALQPGGYWVTGNAIQYWLSGDFVVKGR